MPQLEVRFLLFVAAFVAAFWACPERWRGGVLAVGSSVFLGAIDRASLCVLAVAVVLVHLGLRARALWTVLGIVGVFLAVRALSSPALRGQPIAMVPLAGFGFAAAKLVHYRVEHALGTFRPHGPLQLYNYVLFFPAIAIGPIHRFEEFQDSEARRRWDAARFARGLERVLHGYAKVVVVAGWLVAIELDLLLAQIAPAGTGRGAFGASLVHGLKLYFSFAGYSDIAIGVALLLGYQLGENFDRPFLKRDLGEFWRSWHISLSDWCRRYVFVPLSVKTRRPAVAMLAAMLVLGLWHELSMRYVAWGLFHGAGLVAWRAIAPIGPRLPRPIATALTFTFVILSFTITRTATLSDAAAELSKMLGVSP